MQPSRIFALARRMKETARVRKTVDQVPEFLGSAYAEVYDHIRKHGAKETAPCLTVWYTPADVHQNEEVEAVVVIDRPIPPSDQVAVYELPQVQVSSVVHHGQFDDFTQGHFALIKMD